MICDQCGDEILDEEPFEEDGETLCTDCWHDEYQFTCCGCEEYGYIADQHNFVVVFEECGVEPGLYCVKEKPYFTSAMIGSGWLHSSALELVVPLPIRWLAYKSATGKEIYRELTTKDGDGFPCGHLCIECQMAIKINKLAV